MIKTNILQLFIDNIPTTHFLNYHVHECRRFSISKDLHPFIYMLNDALSVINKSDPNYAERIVKWIATLTNKEEYEQNFSVFGEILILKRVCELADVIDGKPYLVSEPRSSKNSKNPEFRSVINGFYYTGEVKTPSVLEYSAIRQEGFQITTHLPDRNVVLADKVVNPKLLTVKDYLVSAEDKFREYIKNNEFKDDYRFLYIVWDDFINEPISALISPYCGLFTENSFYKNSNFNLVDGVFIIRHLHQFHRIVNNKEFINGINHAFDWPIAQFPVAYIQNPYGRLVPNELIASFEAIDPRDMFTAEYKPTDWIDWRTGLAISGLSSIPQEYHKDIFKIMLESTKDFEPRVLFDSASFGTINIDKFIEGNINENGSLDMSSLLIDFKQSVELLVTSQKYWEHREREEQEKIEAENYNIQIQTLRKAMGILTVEEFENKYLSTRKKSGEIVNVHVEVEKI